MRISNNSIAAGLLAFANSAGTARFSRHCAWELAQSKRVKTTGEIMARCADGNTYCFSNETAKDAFLENAADNARKANSMFERLAHVGRS